MLVCTIETVGSQEPHVANAIDKQVLHHIVTLELLTHHAVNILHKLLLHQIHTGDKLHVLQPEVMIAVEEHAVFAPIHGQLILVFGMRFNMRETVAVVKVHIAQRRDDHASRLGTGHILRTIVGQGIGSIDNSEFALSFFLGISHQSREQKDN